MRRKDNLRILLALALATALASAEVPVMAEEAVPVIDLGTFHNTYTPPTDSWLDDGWDYEVKEKDGDKYILLTGYSGDEEDITVSGAAIAAGELLPVRIAHSYDSGTGHYSSAFSGNSKIKTITFERVEGMDASAEDPGNISELFRGMPGLKRVDFGEGLGGKPVNISGLFEGCTALAAGSLAGLDTSECTKAYSVFKGCTAMESVDMGSADLGKAEDTSGMFKGCEKLTSLDLSKALWNSGNRDTSEMFADCPKLTEITVPPDFTAGTDHREMFRTDAETILKVKGGPSEAFKNAVFPGLKSDKRYLGTAKATAKITLSGKDLEAGMFTYRLYYSEVKAGNLIGTAHNSANGEISFSGVKVYDTTEPLKLVMVQEEAEGFTADKGSLTVSKTILLKPDGSLGIAE